MIMSAWPQIIFSSENNHQISEQEYSPTKKLIFDVNGDLPKQQHKYFGGDG